MQRPAANRAVLLVRPSTHLPYGWRTDGRARLRLERFVTFPAFLAHADKFLTAYAAGLAMRGYRNSPLQVIAYDLEDYFRSNGRPINVLAAVRSRLEAARDASRPQFGDGFTG